jgi:plastocyanin
MFYVVATFAAMATPAAHAAALQVRVVDNSSKPLADVVVVATPTLPSGASSGGAAAAEMDQIEKRFAPEVLVIRAGTAVAFPNHDSVAHQVYSFSKSKSFQLPLYRGRAHPPVVFDQPGIVVLGCNIHDHMAAYIFVTPSPYFGKTDAQGRVSFTALPAGDYKLTVWSPYFNETVPDSDVTLSASQALDINVALTRHLRPQRPAIDPRTRDY